MLTPSVAAAIALALGSVSTQLSETAALRAKIGSMRSAFTLAVANLNGIISGHVSTIASKQLTIDTLTSQSGDLSNQVAALTTQLSGEQAANTSLQAALGTLQAAKEAVDATLVTVTNERNATQASLSASEAALAQANEDLNACLATLGLICQDNDADDAANTEALATSEDPSFP